MKRILLALALLFALGSTTKLAAQETRVRFYYYPSTNVYYNPASDQYWYYDDVSTTWTEVKTLPTTITLTKTPRYTVYYNGEDVWKDNATHMQKYKARKNGTIKQKIQRITKQSQALTRADLLGIRFFLRIKILVGCGNDRSWGLFADILFAMRNSETSGTELVHCKLVKPIF